MTERPMATGAGEPRLRRRLSSRLRDMPIWSKLGVIMIVPLVATVVVGTNGLVGHIDTASGADRARALATLSSVSGELVHQLQNERAAAVMLLGADADEAEAREATYLEIQQRVDDAERPFQQRRGSLTDVPAGFRDLLEDIGNRISGLPQLRTRVAAEELGLTDVSASYGELINNLVTIRESSAQFAADANLGDRMRATASIARAKEFLARQRVVGHEVLIRDAYGQQLRSAFIGTVTGQDQALEAYDAVADDRERALLDQALAGPDVRQSLLYRDFLDSLEGEDIGTPPWEADAWDAVMVAHANLLRDLERELDTGVVAEATDLRDAVIQRILVETGLLLGMLLIAILLAWLVARSMARSLRDLRQGALAVAQHGLPDAVARLRDPNISTHLTPEQIADQIAEPLPVRSKDEFGQVTEAFNTVHLEAVRTAAEQARLRSSVSTMFVNLARRSQILVDRLIVQLDRLERGEEDPDRLAELFQLDHLATRMRRNDENLLVLAGADSSRMQREPAGLIDVLRAAQSEVEHYTRIEFGVVDRDLEVAAHAVNDLVHLVAELFDNATAFSPPDSQVVVEARRVGDRAVLYVEDRGLGMSPDMLADINERLATPPQVDVTVSRMMGLVVVARLASRHGVKVELRRASERGTVADVTLPTSVLVPRALAGRLGPTGAFNSAEMPAASTPGVPGSGNPHAFPGSAPPAPAAPSHPGRPMSPAPLALEGGRDSGGHAPGMPPPQVPGSPYRPAHQFGGGEQPYGNQPYRGEPTPSREQRSMPAWSDLTGAGSNGSAAPASSPGLPPTAPGLPPLPQRRPNDGRPAENGSGFGGGRPGESGSQPYGSPYGGGMAGADAPTAQQPRISPPPAPPSTPPQSAPPPAVASPHAAAPSVPQPAAPPIWPPVAPTSPAATPAAAGPPAGVQRPVVTTGADGTAEIPRPRTDAPPARPYTPPRPAPAPVGDQTMELPIFTELESVWFRTRQKGPAQAETPAAPATAPAPSENAAAAPAGGSADRGSVDDATTEYTAVSATGTTTGKTSMGENTPASAPPAAAPVSPGRVDAAPSEPEPVRVESTALPRRQPERSQPERSQPEPARAAEPTPPPAPAGAPAGAEGGSWRTAADDGWKAASAVAEPVVREVTDAGLPKRRPMAQLVPGGVTEKSAGNNTGGQQRRTPEAVRGLLSAYHRGVQRGRKQPDGGDVGQSQSTQAGKEREA